MYNTNILAKRLWVIVFLVTLVFFNCTEPFSVHDLVSSSEPPKTGIDAPGGGGGPSVDSGTQKMVTVMLTMNESARTISPTLENDTYKSFIVIFLAEKPENKKYFKIKGGLEAVLSESYPIFEGWYEKIVVLAFITDDWKHEKLGAIGENKGKYGKQRFEVKSTDAFEEREIFLDLLDSSVPDSMKYGFFDWIITGSVGLLSSGDTAQITITSLSDPSNIIDTINLLGRFESFERLDTGIYNVTFDFAKSGYSSARFSEILYIGTGGAVSYCKPAINLVSTSVNVYYDLNYPGAVNPLAVPFTVGTIIPKPSDPSNPDSTYEFKSWCRNNGKPWDFIYDRILSNITLYAKWDREPIITTGIGDIELVWIPEGKFTIGSPDDGSEDRGHGESQQSVTLTRGFYMGKYEVTQEQYKAVMGALHPYNAFGGDKRPVDTVTWYAAIEFCNTLSLEEGLQPVYKIKGFTDPAYWGTAPINATDPDWDAVTMDKNANGYRLPTEAEWEYACRAGTTTAYNTGATISGNTGWYSDNSDTDNTGRKTQEVGKKPPNAWGLYDMHGNVFEWCWDFYDDEYAGGADPLGASGDARVKRGGSFDSNDSALRSASRGFDGPGGLNYVHGFRVVRF